MAQSTWTNQGDKLALEKSQNSRLKFAVGGAVIIAAVIFLVVNAMSGNTQLYKTVDEYFAEEAVLADRDLRIAGWVIEDSIEFTQIDATTSRLEFDIVENLENPGRPLRIVVMNEPKPDLLRHEAEAMVEGRIVDGEFVTNPGGLFLKCPTRYEDAEAHPAGVGG